MIDMYCNINMQYCRVITIHVVIILKENFVTYLYSYAEKEMNCFMWQLKNNVVVVIIVIAMTKLCLEDNWKQK